MVQLLDEYEYVTISFALVDNYTLVFAFALHVAFANSCYLFFSVELVI